MSKNQLEVARFCYSQYTELTMTREERLEFSSAILSRHLTSSKDLDQNEWQRIADAIRGYRFLKMLSDQRQPLLPPLP
jgi:hypothetical protein